MSPRRPLRIALALSALFPASAYAGDPLPALAGDRPKANFCFSRVYDAAHLRRHPGQRTASILVSLEYDKATGGAWLRAQLRQNGRPEPANVVAGCEWSATAGRNTSGDWLAPTYRKEAGFACIAIYNASSAEEAGAVVFDIADDASTITVHFQDEIGLWHSNPDHMLKLHREDRVFRLDRAEPGRCQALDDAVRPEGERVP
jgi:hypothetical protein